MLKIKQTTKANEVYLRVVLYFLAHRLDKWCRAGLWVRLGPALPPSSLSPGLGPTYLHGSYATSAHPLHAKIIFLLLMFKNRNSLKPFLLTEFFLDCLRYIVYRQGRREFFQAFIETWNDKMHYTQR